MNFSSFGFGRKRRVEDRHFVVIGLGRFGQAVVRTLIDLGFEVMGVDCDQKIVEHLVAEQLPMPIVTIDSTDPLALKQLSIQDFDTAIIAIGDDFLEQSIITTLNVKDMGVRHVVAKASSDIHGTLLRKVGADQVVYPEKEMGIELARSLTQPNILDRLELDADNSIVEVPVPAEFFGKTILELELRRQYNVNILAVETDGKYDVNPNPSMQLHRGSSMILIGTNRDICRLPIGCAISDLQTFSGNTHR
jgi:trk system potassium uptake protein TrkA